MLDINRVHHYYDFITSWKIMLNILQNIKIKNLTNSRLTKSQFVIIYENHKQHRLKPIYRIENQKRAKLFRIVNQIL